MFRCRPDPLTVLVAASVWFLGTRDVMAQSSAGPASLHWFAPPLLPPGAFIAVVSGDPTRPGKSTLQVAMPNGYRFPAHSHPGDEHVEVIEGTLLVGVGDRLDPRMTQALAAGDTATAPAGINHFSVAKGRTVVSVTFMGPYTITYVRAEDAPRPQNFPFGY
jgi:quercetin dioxygenase-like cupin family protein